MYNKSIKLNINSMFVKYAGIDFEENPSLKNKKLLGSDVGITPRMLVYIYCMIEEELGYKIDSDKVVSGEFDTFNNVCEAIIK